MTSKFEDTIASRQVTNAAFSLSKALAEKDAQIAALREMLTLILGEKVWPHAPEGSNVFEWRMQMIERTLNETADAAHAFEARVREEEREACAKLADTEHRHALEVLDVEGLKEQARREAVCWRDSARSIAVAIRARALRDREG